MTAEEFLQNRKNIHDKTISDGDRIMDFWEIAEIMQEYADHKQLTLTDVSQQRELLLAYEQSKCPETWWMSKNQAENEVNDFIANNCG